MSSPMKHADSGGLHIAYQAVWCTRSVGQLLEPLGVRIRAGVHTGEVEIMGEDNGGIAVHDRWRSSRPVDTASLGAEHAGS